MSAPEGRLGPPRIAALAAVALRWPAELGPMVRRSAILLTAWWDLAPSAACPQCPDGRAAAQYLEAWRATLAAATETFAQANGWRVAATPFSSEQLRRGRGSELPGLFDWSGVLTASPEGVQFFRKLNGMPAAIVLHHTARELAAPAGLTAVPLPASWRSPWDRQALCVLRAG